MTIRIPSNTVLKATKQRFDHKLRGFLRGAFINTAAENCSIHESGRMIYNCLRDGPAYALDYFNVDEIDNATLCAAGRIKSLLPENDCYPATYDFWIFNWHVLTMARHLALDDIERLGGLKFAILLELEPGNPQRHIARDVFQGYMAIDPTVRVSRKTFAFPRPLEFDPNEFPVTSRSNVVPVISSFGFATPGKGFEVVVEAVNREFDQAIVRINIPPGAHVEPHNAIHRKNYAQQIADVCHNIAKPGIEVQCTFDFMSPRELILWCQDSDLNCFLYTRRQAGLAATTDQAIISGRPLVTSSNDTFRHIHPYIPPYPVIGLRDAMLKTAPVVRRIQQDWARSSFVSAFERMLAFYGLRNAPAFQPYPMTSAPTKLVLLATSTFNAARPLATYEARLAECLMRSRTYAVVIVQTSSLADLQERLSTDRPSVLILAGVIDYSAEIAPQAAAAGCLFIRLQRPNSDIVEGDALPVLERRPIIPYCTNAAPIASGPPCIWLIGFDIGDPHLKHVVEKIVRELSSARILLNILRDVNGERLWRSVAGTKVTIERANLPREPSERIAALAASSCIVISADPSRLDDLETVACLALTTERAVAFTRAAPFSTFGDAGVFVEDTSFAELVRLGSAAHIGLYVDFGEGATLTAFERLVAENSVTTSDVPLEPSTRNDTSEAARSEMMEAYRAEPNEASRDASLKPTPPARRSVAEVTQNRHAEALRGTDVERMDIDPAIATAYFRILGRLPSADEIALERQTLQSVPWPTWQGQLLLSPEGHLRGAAIFGDAAAKALSSSEKAGDVMRTGYRAILGRKMTWSEAIRSRSRSGRKFAKAEFLGELLMSAEGTTRMAALARPVFSTRPANAAKISAPRSNIADVLAFSSRLSAIAEPVIRGTRMLKRRSSWEAGIVERLFDRNWYLSQHADVAEAGVDPLLHYLRHGSKEGRRPNVVFDPTWYRSSNEDLAHWTRDPLTHFVLHGRLEGRRPSVEFDPAFYLQLHPDVAASQFDATEHYVRHGRHEGRRIGPDSTPAQIETDKHTQLTGPEQYTYDKVDRTAHFARIKAQAWSFHGGRTQTDDGSLITRELSRALKEMRLDIGASSRRTSQSIHAVVATSASDTELLAEVDVLIANLLEEHEAFVDIVADANRLVCGVACATQYARDRLIASGLTAPSAAIGIGVDHWDHIVASETYAMSGKLFRFLHIVSDPISFAVVLESFVNVFDSSDDVSLVVVAPSRDLRATMLERVAQARIEDDFYPDVILITEDLSDTQLKAIYQSCFVYLSANKAYGFDLPTAKAMLSGLPPVVMEFGGHMDYCDSDNAWLVDFDMVRAEQSSLLETTFTPTINRQSLEDKIWEAYACGPQERFRRAWAGRKKLLSSFTWKDVARRLADFATREEKARLAIGWVTTWNARCGIGIYVEHLLSSRSHADHTVFAARQEPRTRPDGDNVVRVWDVDKVDNSFAELEAALASRPCDAIVIQFNYGFFNHAALGRFIEQAVDRNLVVFVDLHSTVDHPLPNFQLADFAPSLRKAHWLLIHNASDWPRMKSLGLANKALFSPLGVLKRPARQHVSSPIGMPLVTSFGFCFEGKGLVELVQAIALLRDRGEHVRLRMLNSEYPAPHSASVAVAIRETISTLQVEDRVDFRTEYLDDETCLDLIAEADLFVNPYKATNESASAATRYGMATGVPVVVTPLRIFDDFGDAVFRMSGTSPEDIANGIAEALHAIAENTPRAARIAGAAEIWRRQHDYAFIAERLERIAHASSLRHLSALQANTPRLSAAQYDQQSKVEP